MNRQEIQRYRENLAEECLNRSSELTSDNGGPDYSLDDHQEEGMLETAVALSDGKDRFSIIHPGGSGKTVLEAGIVQASQAAKANLSPEFQRTKDVILTVERSLMESVRRHVSDLLDQDVGMWGMGKRELDPNVIVANIQALQQNRSRLPNLLNPKNVSLVIGDEADKFLTQRRQRMLDSFSNAVKIGLTATDEWPDGRHVNDAWGETAHKLTLREGIERGINVPASYFLLEANLDGDDIRVANDDYNVASLSAALKSVEIETSVAQIYKTLMIPQKRMKKFPTIVYVPSINTLNATTEKLRQTLTGEDVNISSWHGSINNSQLSREIKEFKDGLIDILVLCEMGGRGLDLPRARCIIDAYPTLSANKLEQRHSRALRRIRPGTKPHKEGFEKPYALIAQIIPRSNAFRPVTLLDILDCWPEYDPGRIIGGASGGGTTTPTSPGASVQLEVETIARAIRSFSPRCNVNLIERADLLRQIKLRDDLPMADDDGFIYLPD